MPSPSLVNSSPSSHAPVLLSARPLFSVPSSPHPLLPCLLVPLSLPALHVPLLVRVPLPRHVLLLFHVPLAPALYVPLLVRVPLPFYVLLVCCQSRYPHRSRYATLVAPRSAACLCPATTTCSILFRILLAPALHVPLLVLVPLPFQVLLLVLISLPLHVNVLLFPALLLLKLNIMLLPTLLFQILLPLLLALRVTLLKIGILPMGAVEDIQPSGVVGDILPLKATINNQPSGAAEEIRFLGVGNQYLALGGDRRDSAIRGRQLLLGPLVQREKFVPQVLQESFGLRERQQRFGTQGQW
eukprot:CAMPEP_0194315872 /NCGR_PEP_ID=MMETSP0171-20130528/12656_1 /TAXON_ID=218684 /ORGANISM="Corethron pennatum, Strain L29A3" /LENGTH=298 /DNA_ID=CAMNT_0039071867 /DNA_START=132 /DNA_END=1028 /DNA_ORIENTATION=+